MKPTLLLLFIFCFFSSLATNTSQPTLSENAEISILTIGPGKYLYDKFGHSAFRINDSKNGWDVVFNYGSYDFNTPNFYTKFAQGKLLYALDTDSYGRFYRSYVYQNRYVKEQVLNLTDQEKSRLFQYLRNNALPENKNYKYDFFYDNCATRIRDVLVTVLGEKITYSDAFIENKKTFRGLIQQNVSANTWGSLGMDVAIGAVTDVKASSWQHQFLPEYVFQATEKATIDRNNEKKPLVKKSTFLFQNNPQKEESNFFSSPLFIFGILGALILLVTYRDSKTQKRSRLLDSLLFFVTGVIGIFIILLWFATDHSATANNYNALWAFPFSIVFMYAIGKKKPKKWVRKYVIFLIVLLALLTLHFITGVQRFAIGLTPLLIALLIRYLYIVRYLSRIIH